MSVRSAAIVVSWTSAATAQVHGLVLDCQALIKSAQDLEESFRGLTTGVCALPPLANIADPSYAKLASRELQSPSYLLGLRLESL